MKYLAVAVVGTALFLGATQTRATSFNLGDRHETIARGISSDQHRVWWSDKLDWNSHNRSIGWSWIERDRDVRPVFRPRTHRDCGGSSSTVPEPATVAGSLAIMAAGFLLRRRIF